MNTKQSIGLTLGATIALLAAGCASGPGPAETQPAGASPGHAQVESVAIAAPSLANSIIGEPTQQSIQVSLPPGYDSGSERYPVVYYLPGFGDTYEVFDASASHSMIVVSINGSNKLGGSFYSNSPVTGNWEDFVTRDVVSYIDSTYRTIAEPGGRAIAGHSMGGFGVLNAVMHTDVYGYAYAMSPGVFDDDGLSSFDLDFDTLSRFAESTADLDDASAHQAYLDHVASRGWPADLSFSYAAAFAPDAEGRAPYVELPARDTGGAYLHDAAWE